MTCTQLHATPADAEQLDGLQVNGLCKTCGHHVALRGAGLNVPRGQLVAFLAATGTGKTTTMRAVLGLVDGDAGTITWCGRPLDG